MMVNALGGRLQHQSNVRRQHVWPLHEDMIPVGLKHPTADMQGLIKRFFLFLFFVAHPLQNEKTQLGMRDYVKRGGHLLGLSHGQIRLSSLYQLEAARLEATLPFLLADMPK